VSDLSLPISELVACVLVLSDCAHCEQFNRLELLHELLRASVYLHIPLNALQAATHTRELVDVVCVHAVLIAPHDDGCVNIRCDLSG